MTTFTFSSYISGSAPSTNVFDYGFFKNHKILRWTELVYGLEMTAAEIANSTELKFVIPSIAPAQKMLNQLIQNESIRAADDDLDFYCMGVITKSNNTVEYFDVVSSTKVYGINDLNLSVSSETPPAEYALTYLLRMINYSNSDNYDYKFERLANQTTFTVNIPPSKLLNAVRIGIAVYPKFCLDIIAQTIGGGGNNNGGGGGESIGNMIWDSNSSAYISQEPVQTNGKSQFTYTFDVSRLKNEVDQLVIANETDPELPENLLQILTGPRAYDCCVIALAIEDMEAFSGMFGVATHQSSGAVNDPRNLSFDQNIIKIFAQQVLAGNIQPMPTNDGINTINVVYESDVNQGSLLCCFVFSYAMMAAMEAEGGFNNDGEDETPIEYAPYRFFGYESSLYININPEYWRNANGWSSNVGQTSIAFIVTNVWLPGQIKPELLNFSLTPDSQYEHGPYRLEFYSYWENTFPDMSDKTEQQWNELLSVPLGELDGFGNIDINIPSDYGNIVIVKVIAYNSGPVEHVPMLTVTAKEIQNNVPSMLAGYTITDLDFASNWYGFALDSNSETTGITNRTTYCKVFRINNIDNMSGAGWVRVTTPDSNAWIYKFNADSHEFGDFDRDGGRKFLLISEEELQKPVYIMVTTPNEYQTGWFNILSGSEDFAGDRRYQIFDSSFNELITLNDTSPTSAFNRYDGRIVEENNWCDINDIQPTKRATDGNTYNKELIDDPRGNGKIWKITPIMNPGSYYEMNSTMLGETFYANRPTDLGHYYVYYKGTWNNNHKPLTPSTVHEFIADAGLSSDDYDDFIITYNSSIGGIVTRKYIGETADIWSNPIPQYRTNFIDLSGWTIVLIAEIYFNGVPNGLLQEVGYNGTYTTALDKLFRESSHFEYSDLKQYFTDPSIAGIIGYYNRTYNNQTDQNDESYTIDYIREVRIGEDYTGTFYIKPLEYL
jgi:hypothetical protein